MRRLLLKLAAFLLPIAALATLQLGLSPAAFTLRLWEALAVHTDLLAGPFYPDQDLAMVEAGDIAPRSRWAVHRPSRWVTDAHGYRTAPQPATTRIVVVGDSMVVGPSVTQEHTLCAQLGRRLGEPVYPYAPRTVKDFLREPRFAEGPEVVVVVSAERFLVWNVRPLPPDVEPAPRPPRGLPAGLRIALDRLAKQAPRRYLRAEVAAGLSAAFTPPRPPIGGLSFLTEPPPTSIPPFARVPPPVVERLARSLVAYRDALRSRGARMLFMAVPNKETVYHRLLRRPLPTLVSRLEARLAAEGVEVVPLAAALLRAPRRPPLYRADDTHWNRRGVALAADLLAPRLREH